MKTPVILSKLKRNFDFNDFFPAVIMPAAALLLYCGSFSYLSSRYLLTGVNYHFADRFGKIVLVATIAACLLFGALLARNKPARLRFKAFPERFKPGDLFLLLLPLTPALQYVLSNRKILSLEDSLLVLTLVALFSGLYMFLVPALLGRLAPKRLMIAVGLAFSHTIVNMAALSRQFAWFEKGALWIQASFFFAVLLAAWLSNKYRAERLLHLFIAANFIVVGVFQLVSQPVAEVAQSSSFEGNALLPLVEGKTPASTPNVYLLVYDSYVSNETMLAYGIDNGAQEQYLAAQGFVLYPQTYSIGAATIPTMSRVLNASSEYYGNERRAASGDGVTQKIFKELGYETYGVFWSDYFFRGYEDSYDYSYPDKIVPAYVQLLKAVFLGEFRFDMEDVGFSKTTREQFIEAKQGIFEELPKQRVFLFMQTNFPGHSQNSGACLPDETELFEARLKDANIEMRADVDLIIENDPGAVVIIAGDHGPYLTKNCFETTNDISEISRLDIQDRHGSFLAIRWPTGDYEKYDDITVLQDVFPAVFAYLYRDAAILDAKIEPVITAPYATSGAAVNNGIIVGGIDDGEPLFLFEK